MVTKSTVELYHGDCLDILPTLADGSVDAVVTDPPYGTIACKWDEVIPFAPMWEQLERVSKERAAIALFASQPFTSALVMSNPKWFRYAWIWNKNLAGNGILAKVQPLKIHEDICVFSRNSPAYYPIMKHGKPRWKGGIIDKHGTFSGAGNSKVWSETYHPVSILEFSGASLRQSRVHPTQKPVALLKYLIQTYTNPGDTVLDFTMGSGTTGVACVQTGRNFIGIEIDEGYYNIAQKRIAEAQMQPRLVDA